MAEEQTLVGEWPIAYVKHKWGITGQGSEQIGVLVLVTDGPMKGRRHVWYGSWSEAALPMTVDGLKALGWAGVSLATLREDLKEGAQAAGVFDYETYEGKQRLRLNFINPTKQIRFAGEMTAPVFQRLGERVHRMIDQGKHLRKGAAAGSSEDDDIPF